jgi:hypothetical protein
VCTDYRQIVVNKILQRIEQGGNLHELSGFPFSATCGAGAIAEIGREFFSQAQAGARQPGFNSRFAQVEHLAGFKGRESFDIAEKEHNFQTCRQPLDCLVEITAALNIEDLFLWQASPIHNLDWLSIFILLIRRLVNRNGDMFGA